MDETQPARRSISGGSISSAYLDWWLSLRRNESGEAGSFIEFDFGDEISLDFPRNSITLTPIRRAFRLLSAYGALEQGSDPGTATPQLHHGELRDAPSEDPLVGNTKKKSEEGDARVLRRKRFFRDWWFWEMLGALLSICCMVAVVILGLYLDGLSLSDWNFVMAPSTVISTSITVAKTSMLLAVAEGLSQRKWVYFWVKKRPLSELEAFEEASRGPWGSIMFFWEINPASLLAWCGAFLTVAALAMGPFAQQVISIQIRTIPRAGANSSSLVTNMFGVTEPNSYGATLSDFEIQTATYSGLLKLGHPFEYNCASGNCSWPDIYSLGVCSTCIDVTSTVGAEVTDELVNLISHEISIPIYKQRSFDFSYAIIAGNASVGDSSSPIVTNFTIAQSKYPYEDLPDHWEPKDEFRHHWNIVECSIT